LAVDLADAVYRVTKGFSKDEQFGLTSQMRRSSVSISANIAEGSGRTTPRDRVRFIEIPYGSLMETVSHMEIARRQGMMTGDDHSQIYGNAHRLARVLSGLRDSIDRGKR
jgi:four helix bundle protein